MKAGISTTEFWITFLVLIICGGVALYAIKHGQAYYSQIIPGIALVVAFLKAHWYEMGRAKVKIQELINQNNAQKPAPLPTPVIVTPSAPEPPGLMLMMKNAMVTTKTSRSKTTITIEVDRLEPVRQSKISVPKERAPSENDLFQT